MVCHDPLFKKGGIPDSEWKVFFFACYARRQLLLDQRIRVHILPDPKEPNF